MVGYQLNQNPQVCWGGKYISIEFNLFFEGNKIKNIYYT